MSEIFPAVVDFLKLAGKAKVIPIYKEVAADLDTPVSAYARFAKCRYSFLLESAEGGERWGRYSFIGFDPEIVFESLGNRVTVKHSHGQGRLLRRFASRNDRQSSDPFGDLKDLLKGLKPAAVVDGLPRFWGGAVGFLAYDMVRFFERVPDRKLPHPGSPDSVFLLTGPLIIFDNLRHRMQLVANLYLDHFKSPEAAYKFGVAQIAAMEKKLRRPLKPFKENGRDHGKGLKLESNFTRDGFCRAVETVKKYITAGDVTQTVISQRLSAKIRLDPLALYRAIRDVSPSPYLYCLKLDGLAVVGSSPEVMVRLEGREMTTRPIAGTRRRGANAAADRLMADELIRDPKERAEHLMLVDLGRNDIGRVAKIGTVVVDQLMAVEKYSHVMHLVSNVRGELKEGLDGFDLVRATLPAGTLTGSPKVRAMEIIEELEPVRRGLYGGAIGYIGFSGDLDLAITIRTAVLHKGWLSLQAGAGIVFDSNPSREYQECLNKAAAMLEAVRRV